MRPLHAAASLLLAGPLLAACLHAPSPRPLAPPPAVPAPPLEPPARPVAIVHAKIWTADAGGRTYDDGTIVLRLGRIAAIGDSSTIPIPEDAVVIQATGLFVTPG